MGFTLDKKGGSPEGCPLIIRPTLCSSLITIAFIKARMATFLHHFALYLHCGEKPKEESPVVRKAEGREVRRHEMPRAKKVLSCEKLKAEKSFSAKC